MHDDSTPGWGTDFTLSRACLADSSTGATLMTIPGEHSIDARAFCLGEFKEVSSVVATQRQRGKIVETGETIEMTSPDQVLLSGVLESGAVASVHIKGRHRQRDGVTVRDHGTEADLVIARPTLARGLACRSASSPCVVRRGAKRWRISRYRRAIAGFHPRCLRSPPSTSPKLFVQMAEVIRERKPVSPNFDVAVKRHQLLDAIQKASDTGLRQVSVAAILQRLDRSQPRNGLFAAVSKPSLNQQRKVLCLTGWCCPNLAATVLNFRSRAS